ncbi:ABC transporter permease [Tenacibaculum agarivorans]|uniref:ABC transporter permease n=1 Tax=Tenacibaculum agarivorans TaxID=1908389 RepID=UPI00094BBD99|nr:ABC transporter permease [Tenacibaculum agarivorans]
MLNLYIKIAIRYLLKNPMYSLINIGGLSTGIAIFILIMAYVKYEKSYDKFEGSSSVYRVYLDYLEGDSFVPGDAMTYNKTGLTLKEIFPEIVEYVRLYYFEKVTFIVGDKIFEQSSGSLADKNFFKIFSIPLVKGDRELALQEPNSIVLNESLAKKLFGDVNPIKKTCEIYQNGKKILVTVTGVMKNIPENSHYKNSFLISFSTQKKWEAFSKNDYELNWNNNNCYTYIKTIPSTNEEVLRNKIIDSDIEKNKEERHNIESIESIHLHSNKPYEVNENGSAKRIKFLTTIAYIIIIISWLNYINLYSTKFLDRGKEVGMRKVVGAVRYQLIIQSLIELMVLNSISIIIGISVAIIFLPLYTSFSGHILYFSFNDVINLLPTFLFLFFGVLFIGLYPAILLSNSSPIITLKKKINASSRKFNIRKILVVFQFIITTSLLIGAIVIHKQMQFMGKQSTGVNLNGVIAVKGEVIGVKNDSLLKRKFNVLKNELVTLPFVSKTAASDTYPGDHQDNLSSNRGIIIPSKKESLKKVFYNYAVDENYFSITGMKFISGKTFNPSVENSNTEVVVNETFLKEMELGNAKDAIGETLKFWNINWTIVGVIEDYNHFGLKKSITPMLIRYKDNSKNLLVQLEAQTEVEFAEVLEKIEKKWSAIFPVSTFNYEFLEKKYQLLYKDDKKFSDAFQIFTLLAILIAAMGLFGLTSYTCFLRKKEIGIRKANGASVYQVVTILNKDFIKWAFLGFIISIPISFYTMNIWLEDFAYRISISSGVIILAGILTLCITIFTVSGQSIQAALNNPTKVLRED